MNSLGDPSKTTQRLAFGGTAKPFAAIATRLILWLHFVSLFAAVSAKAASTVVVTNTFPPLPVFYWTVQESIVPESLGRAVFTLNVAPAPTNTASVSWFLASGTASPGIDIAPPFSGVATFGPGQTSTNVEFTLIDDQQPGEPSETITVGLNNPQGGVISSNSFATITIIDDDVIVTNPPPLLTFTKTVFPDQANPGDPITFTLTLSNSGLGAATNVTVSDFLPAGLNFVQVVSGPAPMTFSDNTALWQFPILAPGTTETMVLESSAQLPGFWTNSAQAQSSTDSLMASASVLINSNTVIVTNVPLPTLSLSKTVSVQEANVGDLVTFTVTVNNAGPGTATNVMVSDFFPAGLDFVSLISGPAPTTTDAKTAAWQFPILLPGDTETLVLESSAQFAGIWTNLAQLEFSTNLPLFASASVVINSNTVIVTNVPLPVLSLSKTASVQEAKVGDLVTFTVTLSNSGPGTATNVMVSDFSPAGLDLVTVVSGPAPVAASSKNAAWQFPILLPGDIETIVLESSAQFPGVWTNVAQAQFSTNSPLFASASVLVNSNIVIVTNLPLLSLTKTASIPQANVGDPVTFFLTVNNNGQWPATNVVVSDALPPGFQFVGAFDSGNPAIFDPGTGLWTIGPLSPGMSRTLTLNTLAAMPGPWTNNADIIVPSNLDPNSLPHGAAFVNLLAPGKADLAIAKEADATPVGIEQSLNFFIRVTNQGPDDSKDIVVKDSLPAGVDYQSSVAPAGTTFDEKKLEWTIPKLPKGQAVELKLVTTAKKAIAIVNTAEITATGVPDPILENNKAQAPGQWIPYSACGTVRFCNGFDGSPHTNAIIELSLNAKVVQTTRSDSQGAFCFTNLPPGKYSLIAKPSDPKSGIKDSPPETIEFGAMGFGGMVQLISPFPAIRGVVTNGTNGPPVADIEVKLSGKTAAGAAVDAKTTTDANGQYLFTDVADGTYTVTPTPSKTVGFTPVKTVIKKVDCLTIANFVSGGAFRIAGKVLTCDPAPVPYATVTLSQPGVPKLRTTVTGQDGAYLFQGLPVGDYTIAVTHPSYDIDSVDVTIKDRSINKNIDAKPKKGIIFARVLDPKGAPVKGIDVAIFPPGAATATATLTTDTNGTVTFQRVPVGIWLVQPQTTDPKQSFTPGTDKVGVGRNDTCRNTCIFTVNLNSVELVAMEAVQVIQDWGNSMPLVEGKPTLLRIFLKPAGSNTAPVTVKGLKLKIEPDGGKAVTLSCADVVARADYAPHRNEKKTSLPIDVTKFAKGNVKFTLQWTNGFLATAPAAAAVIQNNSVTVHFTPMPPLQLKWIVLNWKFGAKTDAADPKSVAEHRKRLISPMPVTNIVAKEEVVRWLPTKDPTMETEEDNTAALYDFIGERRRRDEPAKSRVIYYTLVPGGIIRDNGIINGDLVLIREKLGTGMYKTRPAHEVGHTLGRNHAVNSAYGISIDSDGGTKNGACSEIANINAPDYPMDILNGQLLQPTLGPMGLGDYRFAFGWDGSDGTYVSPYETLDLMSYCGGKTDWTWPGLYTYTNLFNAIVNRFGKGGAPAQKDLGGVPSIIIAGSVDLTAMTASLDPVWPTLNPTEPSVPQSGDFTLRLFDMSGTEIYAASFAPESLIDADPAPVARTVAPFHFVVPQSLPIAAMEVDLGNEELVRREVSAHAPTVNISAPAPGTGVTSPDVLLQWNGTDLDGDVLRYAVDVSSDGGVTWTSLVQDLDATEWTVSAASLPGTSQTLLRVTASDGLLLGSDQVSISIGDHPPIVTISSPDDGAVLTGDLPATLSAFATDFEDGTLDGTNVVWTSDRDGVLGQGATLTPLPADLSAGAHLLTVTATDSLGQSATASINVTVVHDNGPTLTATLDGDDLVLSWPAAYDLWLPQGNLQLDSSNWFLISGDTETDGETITLRTPLSDEAIYYRLSAP